LVRETRRPGRSSGPTRATPRLCYPPGVGVKYVDGYTLLECGDSSPLSFSSPRPNTRPTYTVLCARGHSKGSPSSTRGRLRIDARTPLWSAGTRHRFPFLRPVQTPDQRALSFARVAVRRGPRPLREDGYESARGRLRFGARTPSSVRGVAPGIGPLALGGRHRAVGIGLGDLFLRPD
jgi:hypothetical protein